MTHAQSPAYIETPQILLPVTYPTKNIRVIHSEQTENLIYPSVKIKRHIHNKSLAPNNGITDLSYTRFG